MSINDRAKELEGQFDESRFIKHHFHPEGGRGYAKQIDIPAGGQMLSHSHPTDHVSILASGRVVVETDEHPPQEYLAPAAVFVRAGLSHSVRALSDAVWFCVHDIQVDDPATVDDVILQRGK